VPLSVVCLSAFQLSVFFIHSGGLFAPTPPVSLPIFGSNPLPSFHPGRSHHCIGIARTVPPRHYRQPLFSFLYQHDVLLLSSLVGCAMTQGVRSHSQGGRKGERGGGGRGGVAPTIRLHFSILLCRWCVTDAFIILIKKNFY
jgi:hypothetical protein